ncbi:MAG TPA: asparagine synthase (glutamine-hydrolyzing) [Candidatus Binatia bacterium]|nr:asparagine synthase (glutamine-hydrolyzing) [Candidatus Binatia bacterium]
MCAIAGLVCFKEQCRGEEHDDLVARMCELQCHRGPDDHGIVSLGLVCLGSNRLSIIDLTEAGHMPMADDTGDWWIVYNGEVYNFPSLRQELIRNGHRFRSGTDTEVVLHAFREWGEACLDRFVGMFAFAVYNRRTDTLTLARDRFGKKPLYYAERSGHLFFASELKALLCGCGPARVNKQRLIEWSLYRNVDFGSPETLVENVFSLLPGHVMKIDRGRMKAPRRYYAPESQVDAVLYDELAREEVRQVSSRVESLIESSVKDRLVSDVPLGTFCSGGIDSSLVTALAARENRDIAAFHVSVAGYQEMDESRYARLVSRALGIELFTYELQGEAFRQNLVRAIYHSDAPLTHANSVAFLLISEFARKQGVKILLSGEAADELFGGYRQRYRRYGQLLLIKRWAQRLPAKVRKALAMAGYACNGVPFTGFSEYEGLLAHSTAFLDNFARESLLLHAAEAYHFVRNDTDRAVLAAMLADLSNFLTPLLRRLDRMSMAASVECRVPFLDHRLVHTVINLPLSYRLRRSTDKWLLKEIAAHHLPRQVVYRNKVGFPLPLRDYLAPLAREELFRDGFCVEFLGLHQKGLLATISNWAENVDGFFNLLALEIWGRLLFMSRRVDELTSEFCAVRTSGAASKRAGPA